MVLTVNTGRDDALLLLRSWAERGTLLRCNIAFARVAATIRVRIRALLPDRVELLSDDTYGEVIVPLKPDLEFGTSDFRREAPDLATTYDIALTLFFPVLDDPDNPESLSFIEVKEDEPT